MTNFDLFSNGVKEASYPSLLEVFDWLDDKVALECESTSERENTSELESIKIIENCNDGLKVTYTMATFMSQYGWLKCQIS